MGSTSTPAPERIEFDLGQVNLHALTWGEPGATLALCLHGYPDTAWTWRYLGPALASRGYYVVAPFTRGYAPSSLPADGDVSTGARVADALDIAARTGADQAVVIGHDWGAFTANALAAVAESPFHRFVALAVPPPASITPTGGTVMRNALELAAQSVNSWYILANQLPVLPERVFTSMTALLWRRWSPGYDASRDLAYLDESAPPQHRSAIIGYYRQLVRARPRSSRHRELDRLMTRRPVHPTLQLHGRTDGCLRPSFYRDLDQRLPTGSRVVGIDDAGHFLHLERPDTVNDVISDYLDSGE